MSQPYFRIADTSTWPTARQGHIGKRPGTAKARLLMQDGKPRTKAQLAAEAGVTRLEAHNAVRWCRRLGAGMYQALTTSKTGNAPSSGGRSPRIHS